MDTENTFNSLLVPRVEVYWGPINLTSPRSTYALLPTSLTKADYGEIGSLVYDVRVSMEDQGQTPSGSMKWNPSGPGFQLYEYCLERYMDYSIMVTFYYVSGRIITFEFYWGGQQDSFGKEMELGIKLVTLMDGLFNANMYATAQADKEEKGRSHSESVTLLEKQFGVSSLELIRYTEQAKADMGGSTVKMSYNDGSNFMDSLQNLVKDNGNFVFFNNIGTSNAVVFTPYSWEKTPDTTIPSFYAPIGKIDPTIRYMYILFPGSYQTLSRTYEWQPPQKSQEISSILAKKAQNKADAKEKENRTVPERNRAENSTVSTGVTGVYGSKTSTNIRSTGNENGPKKQDLFTKERAAKLSTTLFMAPVFVGVKPLDILLVPNYSGSFVEDWVVTSVEYQQTQGGVDLSIQAVRPFGSNQPINPFVGKQNIEKLINDSYSFTGKTGVDFAYDYTWVIPGMPTLTLQPQVTGAQAPPVAPGGATESTNSTPAEPPTSKPSEVAPPVKEVAPGQFVISDPEVYTQIKTTYPNSLTYEDRTQTVSGNIDINTMTQIVNSFSQERTQIPAAPPPVPAAPAPAAPAPRPTPAPTSANTAFQALGPYTVQVGDPGFFSWLQKVYQADPGAKIDPVTRVIQTTPQQIQRLYEVYTNQRRGY